MSCCGSGSLSVGPGEGGGGTSQRAGGQHDLSGPQPSTHQRSPEAKPPSLQAPWRDSSPVMEAKGLHSAHRSRLHFRKPSTLLVLAQ